MTRCEQKCDLYRTPCAPYGIHFRKELQKQKYRSRREHHAEISFKTSKRNHFWDTTRGSVTIKEKDVRFIIIKMEELLPDLIGNATLPSFSYLEALNGSLDMEDFNNITILDILWEVSEDEERRKEKIPSGWLQSTEASMTSACSLQMTN